MVKNAVESTEVEEFEPVAPILSYDQDVGHWDDEESLKQYVIDNTVGLKTGHDNKARYYIVRAPNYIVRHAAINQVISNKDDDKNGNNPNLITAIFTIYLYRSDRGEQKRRFIIGVTDRIDDKRKFYGLTGGLRQIKARILADETRFKNVLHSAVQAAQQWGITLDKFSNQIGLNRREYVRPTDATGQNAPSFGGYTDVEGEATDW